MELIYDLNEFYSISKGPLAASLIDQFGVSVRPTLYDLAKEISGNPNILMSTINIHNRATTVAAAAAAPSVGAITTQQPRHTLYGNSGRPGATISQQQQQRPIIGTSDQTQSPLTKIRLLLNKLTDKNYDEYSVRILRAISLYELTKEMCEEIFNISASNNFYVKIYAKLFAQMVEKNTLLKTILDEKVAHFMDNLNNAQYVDQSNYDAFCKMNDSIDKRKALSLFFIHCAQNNILDLQVMVDLLTKLLQKIAQGLYDEQSKMFMDEVCEHVATFCNGTVINAIRYYVNTRVIYQIHVNIESNLVTSMDLLEFICYLSKCSIRTHKGLTSKAIFKFGDIATLIKNTP